MKKRFTLLLSMFVFLLLGTYVSRAQTYCTPSYSSGCIYGDGLVNISFSTTNQAISCAGTPSYYHDYTSGSAATLIPGTTASISFEAGYNGTYVTVWIDVDNNGTFSSSEIMVNSYNCATSYTTYTTSFTVPSGNYGTKRLRFRTNWLSGITDPCGSATYGNSADFTVNIPAPAVMKLGAIEATHPDTNYCFISQNMVKILKATVTTYNGIANPLPIDTVWFSTNGTTNPADILNVKLFHTDGDPLNPYNQLGETIMKPNGTFMFVFDSGSVLAYGANNIILAYDLSHVITPGNKIDCQLLAVRINDTVRTVGTAGDPALNRPIVHPKDYHRYCGVNRTAGANYLIGLTRVIFENIDHQSGVPATTGDVVDFYADDIATVYKQKSYPIMMQNAAFNNRGNKMYIDWNNNGYFDANEFIKLWDNLAPATVINDVVNIPCDATIGYHRMRIVIDLNGQPMPACGNNTYGEAEDYLLFVSPEDTPVVSFTPEKTLNYVGGLTRFNTETSVDGNIVYVWDYDNNSSWDDTTSANGGTHQFNSAGTKTVRVKGLLYGCTDTIEGPVYSKSLSIIAPTTAPGVNFITNLNTVTPSIPVEFTDLSTIGPNEWKWSITPVLAANGNPAYTLSDPNEQNPTVQFLELGNYDVQLWAKNIIGADSNLKTHYISVGKENIMCTDGSTNLRSGYIYDDGGKYGNYADYQGTQVYVTCTFLIEPKCASAVSLDFLEFDVCSYNSTGCIQLTDGDNVRVYDGKNNTGTPLHLVPKDILGQPLFPRGFTNGGSNAAVTIPSVTAPSGKMFIEFNRNCGGVGTGFEAFWSTTIFTPQMPVASIAGPTNVYRLKTIEFASTSSGYDLDYFWDLNGDGFNDTYDSVTTWVYTNTGTTTVRLIIQSCDFLDTAYLNVTVINPTAPPVVDFEADYVRITKVNVVNLMDKSDNTVYSYFWTIDPPDFNFMQGTDQNSSDIQVQFTDIGYYTVKLVCYNAVGIDSMVKTNYIRVYNNCEPGVANLNADLGMSEFLLTNLAGDTLIRNLSSIGQKSYTDYSATKFTDVYLTGTYNLTLKRNSNFNNINWTVFADLNQDGLYDGPADKLAELKNTSQTEWTTTITIPAGGTNVFTGLTKLRIAANAGILNNKGCGPNYSGEFEDYGLIVKDDDVAPYIVLYDRDSSEVMSPDTIILNSCANWVEPGYLGWDDVSGDLTSQVIVNGTSAINPLVGGYYPLTYDVQDNAGNNAMQAVRVVQVLSDIVPLTITPNGNIIDSVAVFSSAYVDPGVIYTDNCSGVDASKSGKMGTVDVNVVGTYVIRYYGADLAGNADTINRYVIVYDGIDPTIALIGNDTIYWDATIPFVDPWVTVDDDYDPDSLLITTVKGTVDVNTLGSYFLTYCVSDLSGNGPVCIDRLVIVEDTEAPTLSFSSSTYTLDVFHPFVTPEPITADNFWTAANIIVMKTAGSVNTYKVGSYPLTFVATDASGNVSAPVVITIDVVDRVAPEIELIGTTLITVERWLGLDDPGVNGRDNYYAVEDLTLLPSTGTYMNTQEVGLYSITYQVEDPSGNKSAILTRFIYVAESTSSIKEVSEENFSYYPNPVSDVLNIEISMPAYKHVHISIFNTLGEQVMNVNEGVVMNELYQVNVSNLAAGIYYIRFNVGEDAEFNKKFILTK